MTWLLFIAAILATYRLSLLFSKEHGPGRVFAKLRKAPPPRSSAREWLSCFFCFSMTASALVCGLLYMGEIVILPWEMWFICWLAFSAGALILNQLFTKGEL